MMKHVCKECFRSVMDSQAADRFMLLSDKETTCQSCGATTLVVVDFFRFGEHEVTPDGKRIKGNAKHIGINPNYSCFEKSYPYADVENYRG